LRDHGERLSPSFISALCERVPSRVLSNRDSNRLIAAGLSRARHRYA
jgi:hypothetical protein